MTARHGQRQHGGCLIVCAMLLVPLLTALGVAIDVSVAYRQSGDMQRLADGIAVAAAAPLDGTLAGVRRAVASAAAAAGEQATALALPVGWMPQALRLGATPDGPWIDLRSISASDAATLAYADVDTGRLNGQVGTLPALLARLAGNRELLVSARAVAVRADASAPGAPRRRADAIVAAPIVAPTAAAARSSDVAASPGVGACLPVAAVVVR